MTDERYEELLVKVVDDLATPAEREELMAHVADHPARRAELEQHMALKAVTDGWVERLELDLVEDRHAASTGFRVERAVGATLLVLGIGVLTGFGTIEILVDAEAPLWLKIGLSAMVSGGLVLLISAVRWRVATRKHDKYTEVVR